MAIIAKPLDRVAADDLKTLIGESESQNFLFRRDPYGADDDGRLEMLRDVSAFANAAGGHLLIGARADNRGRLAAVEGIQDGPAATKDVMAQCAEHIEEQIMGLGAVTLDAAKGRQAVLVFVPESAAAPHMVTFAGTQEFWKRYGPARNRMSVAEIRAACQASGSLVHKADELHDQRKQLFLNAINAEPYLRLACTPLAVPRDGIDVSDDAIAALLMSRRWGADLAASCGMTDPPGKPGSEPPTSKPSAEGLTVEASNRRRQEILRSGFLEFRVPVTAFDLRKERPALEALTTNPRALCEFAIDFMHLARDVYERAQVTAPVVVRLGLYNAQKFNFYPFPQGYSGPTQANRWQESEHLELGMPPIAHPFEPVAAAKGLLDRFWNAFGHAGCPFFDVRGRYIFSIGG